MAKQDEERRANPSTPSLEWEQMLGRWGLVDTLLGGTDVCRSQASWLLPRHAEETDAGYNERIERSILFNVTGLTVSSMAGKPFCRPLIVNDPGPVEPWLEDIDAAGSTDHTFAHAWFKDGFAHGLSHVLVDFPELFSADDRTRTLDDDRRDGVRPYLNLLGADRVFALRTSVINGREIPVHVRFWDNQVVPDGFAEVVQERIRQFDWTPEGVWTQSWVKNDKDKWVQELAPVRIGLREIPLVTFYTGREGLLRCKPPVLDLAYLNAEHYRSDSDQRNCLTVARFPILAVSGSGGDDQLGQKMAIGPRKWLSTLDPQGRYYYVEHTGAALAAGRNDLTDLETRMGAYGAQFLTKRPDDEAATSRGLDSTESQSDLEVMALNFEDVMGKALRFMAEWTSQEFTGRVDICTSLTLNEDQQMVMNGLLNARAGREISRETFWRGLQRIGILDEDFDIAAEASALEKEEKKLLKQVEEQSRELGPDGEPKPELNIQGAASRIRRLGTGAAQGARDSDKK